jgi:hypothetical protein
MPNPKTIEELLKMDACPFKDGQEISYNKVKTLAYLMDVNLFEYCLDFFILYDEHEMLPFKMPDGYFYLPPDKQLGLPLGYYSSNQLLPLIDSLPLSVLKEYCWRQDIACITTRKNIHLEDFGCYFKWFKILKQPPNLYCPLDHVEPETIVYMYDAIIANELWYYKDFGDLEHIVKQGESWDRDQWFEISYRIEQELFITATNPTAWLSHKAKQEGKN